MNVGDIVHNADVLKRAYPNPATGTKKRADMDWSIYAVAPNSDAPIFPEDHEDLLTEPIWQLRVQPHPELVGRGFLSTDELDEWGLTVAPHCRNVDYYTCRSAARDLQLQGSPIGG